MVKWTLHTCEGVQDHNEIYKKLSGTWELKIYAGGSRIEINFCPWCGSNLKDDDTLETGTVTSRLQKRVWDLEAKVAEQDKEIQQLREFAKIVLRYGFEGDLCGGDIQELGVKNGLLNEEIYDPDKHGQDFGQDFEPGDTIYMFSDVLKKDD